jgi:predicted double-glycine peptidase
MRRRAVLLCALASTGAFASTGCMWPLPPTDRAYELPTGFGSMTLRKDLESVRERRFRNVVAQQLDYSCGAAALATLLRFHYGDQTISEHQIIVDMLKTGDADRIRREGFSLLDLKRYAESRGYETKGFRIKAEVLERLAIPSITLINSRGYLHFVVLKGARDGTVYLADPAMGERNLPQGDFEDNWEGVVFFVAARRDDSVPSPLQVMASNRTAPIGLVRELDPTTLAQIRADPREF